MDLSHETKASNLQEPSKNFKAKNESTETQAEGGHEPVENTASHGADQKSDRKRKTEDDKQILTRSNLVDSKLGKQGLNKENETDSKPPENKEHQVSNFRNESDQY